MRSSPLKTMQEYVLTEYGLTAFIFYNNDEKFGFFIKSMHPFELGFVVCGVDKIFADLGVPEVELQIVALILFNSATSVTGVHYPLTGNDLKRLVDKVGAQRFREFVVAVDGNAELIADTLNKLK